MRGTVKGIIADSNTILVQFEESNKFTRDEVVEVTNQKQRSLNANAYFHKLVALIAEKLGNSNAYQKNLLIRRYGQYEYIDGQIPTVQIKSVYDSAMDQREDIHFNPIGINGEFTKYAIMRGSHTYDVKEMSRLIDGTVSEAKELGIETLTNDEIRRLEEAWAQR